MRPTHQGRAGGNVVHHPDKIPSSDDDDREET